MGEQLGMFEPRKSWATLSPCGKYRYVLGRMWDEGKHRVLWVMLNPSKATADKDDPTIRKCIAYSKEWGYGSLEVVNLYAWRATEPDELIARHRAGDDVEGPDNGVHVLEAVNRARLVIAAWGSHKATRTVPKGGVPTNARAVLRARLDERGMQAHALRVAKGGAPYHPLYLPGFLRPKPFEVPR